jgi:DNA-binding NarL/FixJ family response regulator
VANIPITVLIVDDHAVFRRGLRGVIADEGGMRVVQEAGNAEDALVLARELEPDVVLMDVEMPGASGIETTRDLKEELPRVKVVLMSTSGAEDEIRRAFEAGAQGYILKSDQPKVIFEAIRGAAAGERHISSAAADAAQSQRIRAESPAGRFDLTGRELEVLRLLARGNRNRQIAAILGVSERTVVNHIRRISVKLGAHDRSQAILIAARRGIIRV